MIRNYSAMARKRKFKFLRGMASQKRKEKKLRGKVDQVSGN